MFFPRILESLLSRQHSAAIGCTKNYQPIGVTVHSHCVESFEGLLQRCRRGRGWSELWKSTIFPEHPVATNAAILNGRLEMQDLLFVLETLNYSSYLTPPNWNASILGILNSLQCLIFYRVLRKNVFFHRIRRKNTIFNEHPVLLWRKQLCLPRVADEL